MKLMKHITIALVLCAIPAMAFGQSVTCDDCTHVVSVYQGHGGLIATADEDAEGETVEMVTYVATCEGVTRSGELTPNDDGLVSMLLRDDTACYGDNKNNSFEIGPVMDGGWYWITDTDNSAVGNLVNKDVLMNDPTDITSAGDTVEVTMGSGAVLLKETATGRVGILSNILPVMDMEPEVVTPCGVTGSGTPTKPYKRRDSECMMGDGGTIVLANYSNAITGGTTRIMDKGSVSRPAGDGTLSITVDLWGNGTGAFFTDGSTGGTNGINFARGNALLAGTAAREFARYQGVTYSVSAGGGVGGGDTISSGTPVEGVDYSADTNVITVTVKKNAGNCSKTNDFSTPVTVNAIVADGDSGVDQVTPAIARATTTDVAGSITFTVMCPAASANQGTELVPDNPFPTTE